MNDNFTNVIVDKINNINENDNKKDDSNNVMFNKNINKENQNTFKDINDFGSINNKNNDLFIYLDKYSSQMDNNNSYVIKNQNNFNNDNNNNKLINNKRKKENNNIEENLYNKSHCVTKIQDIYNNLNRMISLSRSESKRKRNNSWIRSRSNITNINMRKILVIFLIIQLVLWFFIILFINIIKNNIYLYPKLQQIKIVVVYLD